MALSVGNPEMLARMFRSRRSTIPLTTEAVSSSAPFTIVVSSLCGFGSRMVVLAPSAPSVPGTGTKGVYKLSQIDTYLQRIKHPLAKKLTDCTTIRPSVDLLRSLHR